MLKLRIVKGRDSGGAQPQGAVLFRTFVAWPEDLLLPTGPLDSQLGQPEAQMVTLALFQAEFVYSDAVLLSALPELPLDNASGAVCPGEFFSLPTFVHKGIQLNQWRFESDRWKSVRAFEQWEAESILDWTGSSGLPSILRIRFGSEVKSEAV